MTLLRFSVSKAFQNAFAKIRQTFKPSPIESHEVDVKPAQKRCSPLLVFNENPQTCSICLDEIYLPSTTNTCLHKFCFSCILRWSFHTERCPLCKVYFQEIYFNFDKDNKHSIREIGLTYIKCDLRQSRIFITPYLDFLFKVYEFRQCLNRRDDVIITPTGNIHYINPFELSPSSILHARFDMAGTEIRKQHYNLFDFVDPFPLTLDSDYIFRSSVDVIRVNPGILEKVAVFLYREIKAVFDERSSLYVKALFFDLTMHFLMTYELSSDFFFEFLYTFIPQYTRQFRHEMLNFILSQMTVQQYDATARYSFPKLVSERVGQEETNISTARLPNKRRDMLECIDKLVTFANLINKYSGGILLQRYPHANQAIVWKIRFDNVLKNERVLKLAANSRMKLKQRRRGSI